MKNNILWILAVLFALVAMFPLIDWFTMDLTRVELFKKWYYLEIIGFVGCIVCLNKIKK